jgi:alanine racemase
METAGTEALAIVADGRGNRLSVDAAAFRHNVGEARRYAAPGAKLLQVVKGDGYGLGLERAVRLGIAAGVDGFCAGTPEEALRVVDLDPARLVLLFTACPPTRLPDLARRGVTVSLNSLEAFEALRDSGWQGSVHVELDCGFGRFGLDMAALDAWLDGQLAQKQIALAGVYTHFGRLDGTALDHGLELFDHMVRLIRARISDPFDTMVASSHLMISHPPLPYSAVDPGRLLYGISDGIDDGANVRPVLSGVASSLIQLNRVDRNRTATIGYGGETTLAAGALTGVFPLGWQDGLSTGGELGHVLVGGQRRRVIARTLLHSIVDLSGGNAPSIGDDVVLIGAQGREHMSLRESAEAQGMSPTELHFRLAGAITRSSG